MDRSFSSCRSCARENSNEGGVLLHPFVIGELAMGNLHRRESVLGFMVDMPQASVASHEEVMHFVNAHRLFGRGIGYVDAHLLASAKLITGCRLWTRDRRLGSIAGELSLASTS